jgi:hypothetical protein
VRAYGNKIYWVYIIKQLARENNMYDEIDYIDHDERICLACSVAGCECDEVISGCEPDVNEND